MARAKRKRTKSKSPKRRPAAKTRARKRPATRKASPKAARGQSERIAQLEAENRRLREEIESLRAERPATQPPAVSFGEQTPLDL
jgi:hypothetical protein